LYGADSWKLRKVDQKYLERFEMWHWRRMEQIIWIDHVSKRVKEKMNILHSIKRRKTNWIGHILRMSSTTHCWRKDERQDGSDGKRRKKTDAATGWP
jgi:hypothetical protein